MPMHAGLSGPWLSGPRGETRGHFFMAGWTDRAPASRRSASGRWKPAANARADLGDAAGVDLDVVITRAVTATVREVLRRYLWRGKDSKLNTMNLARSTRASDDEATEDNEDGAKATVEKKKKRSPSYKRRSDQRRRKFMEARQVFDVAGQDLSAEAAEAAEAAMAAAAMEPEPGSAECVEQRQTASEQRRRKIHKGQSGVR